MTHHTHRSVPHLSFFSIFEVRCPLGGPCFSAPRAKLCTLFIRSFCLQTSLFWAWTGGSLVDARSIWLLAFCRDREEASGVGTGCGLGACEAKRVILHPVWDYSSSNKRCCGKVPGRSVFLLKEPSVRCAVSGREGSVNSYPPALFTQNLTPPERFHVNWGLESTRNGRGDL